MGTSVLRPEASGDDGHWFVGGTIYPSYQVAFGMSQVCGFVRFPSSTIPPGSQIVSAVPKFVAHSATLGSDFSTTICFADVDNPSAPTTSAEADSIAKTSGISWVDNTAWTIGQTYYGPDISSKLQLVVDRSGYSTGNSILLFIIDNGSGRNNAQSVDTSYSNRITLDVEWSDIRTGNSSFDLPSLSMLSAAGQICSNTLPAMSMDVFPLAISGAVADMSIPALQSLPLGGEALLPAMEMAATGYEDVAGVGANGSISLRINNDGLGGISCSATSAPLGASTIPATIMSATAKPGNDGVMTLPLATMTGLVGARGEAILPLATVASWTTNPGNGVVAMTQMNMSAAVTYANIVGQGVMTMRGVDAAATGLVGQVGSADLGIKMSVFASCIQAKHASASARMIPPTVNGIASINLVGEASADMYYPRVTATATANSSEFTRPIVYEKGAVR